ncbi:MAG: QueT transporter family protein [Gemmatimonadota bacterium]|nr:QueT transporter family protein [Gemmatimonadota bacterium]
MKEAFAMWKYTRMVVLVALSAAMYAAVLLPFKLFPVIPGITEARPANVFPVICSLMFGPAGAWGSALGNFIGDLLGGTYGLGSYFGLVANFWYGYLPYRIWRLLTNREPLASWGSVINRIKSGKVWHQDGSISLLLMYLAVTFVASLACAVQLCWGIDILGIVPYHILAPAITLNNFIAAGILGPLLLPVLYPRVKKWGLLYTDIMDEEDLSSGHLPHVAHFLIWGVLLVGLVFGISISLGITGSQELAINIPGGYNLMTIPLSEIPEWSFNVGSGLIPIIVLLFLACLLI